MTGVQTCALPISEHRKGKPSKKKGVPLSDETKKKISIAMTGKIKSVEERQKISEANRKRIIKPETKLKLSIAAKIRESRKKNK